MSSSPGAARFNATAPPTRCRPSSRRIPRPRPTIAPAVPASVERVVLRCLEKNPAERFQSARDLGFALEALSGPASAAGSGSVAAATAPPRRNAARMAGIAALSLALLAGAFWIGGVLTAKPAPTVTLTRLTFDRGVVRSARFAPDGQTVVYGAGWNGAPLRVFLTRTDTGESRLMEMPDGDVHAVSASGDMLLSLGRRYLTSWTPVGTLARGRLFSTSVREVLEQVREADFLENDAIVVVRRVGGRDRLEVPQGTVVFETAGYISHVRVAPDRKRVAFLEHPLYGDNRGHVAVFENGKMRRLTPEYGGIEGLAWSADGSEIWYSGGGTEAHWMIMAVEADAATEQRGRIVWYVPSDLTVHDINARGQVLVSSSALGGVTKASANPDDAERDIGTGFWTLPGRLSRDGRVAIATSVDTVDPDYAILTRRLDGSPPVIIGSGRAQELSPDGKWGLSITPSQPQKVYLLPTGPGERRELDVGDLSPNVGTFVPGGLRVVIVGRRGDTPAAAVIDAVAGTRTTLDLPELRGRAFSLRRFLPTYVSPDGLLLAVAADDGKILAWPLPNGGPAREIAALGEHDQFVGWTADPSRIYVSSWIGGKARIETLDLVTARRVFFRDITAVDSAGMLSTPDLSLSADGGAYMYGHSRMLSTLYLVSGLR